MPDLSLFIYHAILPMIEFFRHMLGSYGYAIIAVTVALKLILLPLSVKQAISSKKMQANMAKIKPDLDKLKSKFELRKKKYENNPQKLLEVQKEFQQEMMEIYKKGGGFNALGGCLPVLLQLPILIALYWAFSGTPFQASIMTLPLESTSKTILAAKPDKLNSKEVNFVDEQGNKTRFQLQTNIPKHKNKLFVGEEYEVKLVQTAGKKEAQINNNDIYWLITPSATHSRGIARDYLEAHQDDLRKSDNWTKKFLDLNIAEDNKSVTLKSTNETDGKFHLEAVLFNHRGQEGFFFIQDLGRIGLYNSLTKTIHWDVVVLLLLMVFSFWLTSKSMSSQSAQMPSIDPKQEKLQKQMQMMMPLVFSSVFIFIPLPAAVFLYLLVSNLIQVLQTYLTNKFVKI